MKILITGGCGFIGSNFIINKIKDDKNVNILNIDKLTYAGNKLNLTEIENCNSYTFEKGDICNKNFISMILSKYQPEFIINFAAETHVDNSITHQLFKKYYLLFLHQRVQEIHKDEEKADYFLIFPI